MTLETGMVEFLDNCRSTCLPTNKNRESWRRLAR